MIGRQPATLLEARAVEIHGQGFCDVTFALDSAPSQPRRARLGVESVPPNLQSGDKVFVHLVLGQATRVEKT